MENGDGSLSPWSSRLGTVAQRMLPECGIFLAGQETVLRTRGPPGGGTSMATCMWFSATAVWAKTKQQDRQRHGQSYFKCILQDKLLNLLIKANVPELYNM